MSDLIKREDAINAVEMFFKDAYIEDADVHCTDMVYEINHIPAVSPWHRVEEPPNFSGKVLVWRDVLGDFGDREYTFDTAYYNGLNGGQIPKGTFFQPIPGKTEYMVLDDVTHWARPEPPVNKMFTK